MKKALFSALAVSTLFALFGCNNRSETQVLQSSQNEALKPMQQSWRGVLPCADCEGIETSLFLQKDGTSVIRALKNPLRLRPTEPGRVQRKSWS